MKNDIVFAIVIFVVIFSLISGYLFYIYITEKKADEYYELRKELRKLKIKMSSEKIEIKIQKKLSLKKTLPEITDPPNEMSVN